jgi:hypothetical protein
MEPGEGWVLGEEAGHQPVDEGRVEGGLLYLDIPWSQERAGYWVKRPATSLLMRGVSKAGAQCDQVAASQNSRVVGSTSRIAVFTYQSCWFKNKIIKMQRQFCGFGTF